MYILSKISNQWPLGHHLVENVKPMSHYIIFSWVNQTYNEWSR